MTTNDATLVSALQSLPIFPLPGVVLFPGATLPLHVFEPRYRTMLSDALATHHHIAIALIGNDAAEGRAPPLPRIVGVGVVVRHVELNDGRSNIVLEGRCRAALDELPYRPPYRRGRARLLPERESNVPAIETAALYGTATAFLATFRSKEVETSFQLPLGLAPGAAADACANALVVDAASRQMVLEELDAIARVRLVTTLLAEQTASVASEERPRSRSAPD